MSPLLELDGLEVNFGALRAVDGVTLRVHAGEVVGLVGESGCGKSTLARAALRLIEPAAGRVLLDGTEVTRLGWSQVRPFRRRFQMTFQDPGGALDPRWTVESTLEEALETHSLPRRVPAGDRVVELLAQVGLGPELLGRHPHELSGGQRQRVGLARALAVGPALLVLDEPLTGLDVSVQAQVLNLLAELQERMGLAMLLISHDLRVVAHLADQVLVMYLGRVVEAAPARGLFETPRHPYTRALLAAARADDQGRAARGEPPGPGARPGGCPFHPRCPQVMDRCRTERPVLRRVADQHEVACLLES